MSNSNLSKEATINYMLSFLYEMECVDNPHLINHLTANLNNMSGFVKNVEFCIDSNNKDIYVYYNVNILGRTFKAIRRDIAQKTISSIRSLLPLYGVRVIFDFNKFKDFLNKLKETPQYIKSEKIIKLEEEAHAKTKDTSDNDILNDSTADSTE